VPWSHTSNTVCPMALGTPMRLLRVPEPFDILDWIFEPKMDGFRALAHVNGHHCTLVSRNGHTFRSWPQLAEEVAHSVRAHTRSSTEKSAASNRTDRATSRICCSGANGRSTWRSIYSQWMARICAPCRCTNASAR